MEIYLNIEPVDIVDIVIVADGDVDDDYDGEGGEHEEEQDSLVQVVELDKGGEGEYTENNQTKIRSTRMNSSEHTFLFVYAALPLKNTENLDDFIKSQNKMFMKWGSSLI